MTDAQARWADAMMNNYGIPAIELVSGSGCHVTDADGRTYTDFLAGIAVNALGHAHPAIVRAVSDQIARLGHVSNYFSHPSVLDLAEQLLQLAGGNKVLLCNSGAEANEAAVKIARLTSRPEIIAAEGGFHGRTMGALAITGQPAKRRPFEPMVPGVRFVPYGDVTALADAVTDSTAALILEPIQGEAGVMVPPQGYLAAARHITAARGALLIIDEVQTGIGRTGSMFACQADDLTPDVMTLAKGLGGGLPMGAVIAYGRAATLLTPGSHGSTFAGNPVCAAAALAVLSVVAEPGFVDVVAALGDRLMSGLRMLGHPRIARVRGRGLLIGVQLDTPIAAAAVSAARQAGYLINNTGPDVLRLAPPLIVTEESIDAFIAAVPNILDAANQEETP